MKDCRHTDTELLDCAINRRNDATEPDCTDETCASRLEKADAFVTMVRDSSFAPFENIDISSADFSKPRLPVNDKIRKPFSVYGIAGLCIAACIAIGVTFLVTRGFLTSSPASKCSVAFVSGNVRINGNTAKCGDSIRKGDSLDIGDNSSAVLSFNGDALAAFGKNTSVSVSESISTSSKISITLVQKNGTSFHHIMKGHVEYTVRSLSASATVNGTSFIFENNSSKTDISLLHGSVLVSKLSDSDSHVLLKPGFRITSDSNGLSRQAELEARDIEKLKVLDSITIGESDVVKDSAAALIADNALKILTGDTVTEQNLSLKKIYEKYHQVSIVELDNGEKYIGYFRQIPSGIEIITEKGIIKFPLTRIKTIAPYEF
jgi:hypothetical protein